jgi:hypothetical protein
MKPRPAKDWQQRRREFAKLRESTPSAYESVYVQRVPDEDDLWIARWGPADRVAAHVSVAAAARVHAVRRSM